MVNDMPLGLKGVEVRGKLPTFNHKGKVVQFKDEAMSFSPKLNTDLGTNWNLMGGPLVRLD